MKSLFKTPLMAGSPVGHADVVVIVSAKSTASTMTADEISKIYLGKSTAMAGGQCRGGRAASSTKVAGKDEAQVKAIWSKLVFTGKGTPPKELRSSGDVEDGCRPTCSIGYIDPAARCEREGRSRSEVM